MIKLEELGAFQNEKRGRLETQTETVHVEFYLSSALLHTFNLGLIRAEFISAAVIQVIQNNLQFSLNKLIIIQIVLVCIKWILKFIQIRRHLPRTFQIEDI